MSARDPLPAPRRGRSRRSGLGARRSPKRAMPALAARSAKFVPPAKPPRGKKAARAAACEKARKTARFQGLRRHPESVPAGLWRGCEAVAQAASLELPPKTSPARRAVLDSRARSSGNSSAGTSAAGNSRKFASNRNPPWVRIASGWNCTPTIFACDARAPSQLHPPARRHAQAIRQRSFLHDQRVISAGGHRLRQPSTETGRGHRAALRSCGHASVPARNHVSTERLRIA